MNKIISIKEKQTVDVELPDGIYTGIWEEYVISVHYNQKEYELTTEQGVRGIGIGIKVIINIKDGEATFQQLLN